MANFIKTISLLKSIKLGSKNSSGTATFIEVCATPPENPQTQFTFGINDASCDINLLYTPPSPDLSSYYTKTQTDTLLATKVDTTALASYVTSTQLTTALSLKADTSSLQTKQDKLTAGTGISIDSSNVISALPNPQVIYSTPLIASTQTTHWCKIATITDYASRGDLTVFINNAKSTRQTTSATVNYALSQDVCLHYHTNGNRVGSNLDALSPYDFFTKIVGTTVEIWIKNTNSYTGNFFSCTGITAFKCVSAPSWLTVEMVANPTFTTTDPTGLV